MPALNYTTSVDIQKTRYKKLVTHVEPQASAVSLLKRSISDHQSKPASLQPSFFVFTPEHGYIKYNILCKRISVLKSMNSALFGSKKSYVLNSVSVCLSQCLSLSLFYIYIYKVRVKVYR